MTLAEIAKERNEMQQQQKSMLDDMQIPWALAKKWLETEKAYQIKLANIESAKQCQIIKEQAKQIEDLKRGIKA